FVQFFREHYKKGCENMIGKIYGISIQTIKAKEGVLSVIESKNAKLFDFKRIYYIYGVPVGTVRGHHAHKVLKQILVCVYGAIEIMYNDGKKKGYTVLDNPSKGLYVGPGIWHTMKWLKDHSVLLVLASDYYDESDYIRNYDEFIRLVKEGYWK
ncbi:hypothetical protein AT15_06245, partial [Kosmotoga arenicorallina S304]